MTRVVCTKLVIYVDSQKIGKSNKLNVLVCN